MPRITKRLVDASEKASARYFVWDSEVKGFGVLVLPSGVKSYLFQYRTPEGRSRRATIGKHGDWTAEEARKKAAEMRYQVRQGRDPLAERAATRQAPTVGEILDAYLKSAAFSGKARSTQAVDRGRIDRHLRPLLGQRHVHLLTPDAIEEAGASIAAGKTAARVKTKSRGLARVTGGQGTARMAVRLLRAILGWAVRERLIAANPAEGLRTGADGARETILADAEGYARLFKALDRLELEERLRRPVADAIRVIALTGARRGEIAGLRWCHVQLQQGRVVLPASGHKTGRKTGKPRIITLPAAAQAIIARQPEGAPEDLVFKPTRGEGVVSLSKPWRTVRAAAELPEGIGLHGLRHSLASHMAMAGAQASEIMEALGHRQLSTAQRYVHWAEDARRALAERAAATALAGLTASAR